MKPDGLDEVEVETSKRGCLSRRSELQFEASAGVDTEEKSMRETWTSRFRTRFAPREQKDGRVEVNRCATRDKRLEVGDREPALPRPRRAMFDVGTGDAHE